MQRVDAEVIAGGKSPAGSAVTLVAQGVSLAMRVIDADMAHTLIPVVGMQVGQFPRIDAGKGVMGEGQRAAEGWSQRQPDVVVGFAVDEVAAGDETMLVNNGIEGVGRRRRRKSI